MDSNLTYFNIKDIGSLKLHGRIDNSLEVVPLLSNGHGIEVNVTGSQLWVEVEADYDNYEPWVAIELNGELVSRFMVDKGKHSICLFRGIDPSRTTRVRFYRETQAMSEDERTSVIVKGLWGDGNFMAPPYYDHKLEFIGDSISSGEGTYGAKSDEDWTAYCMSYSRTYINLTGKALNAECRVISQGGWGVFCGWDNDRRHVIGKHYEQICGLASYGDTNKKYNVDKPHDFTSWIPDAVIINLGTNDASGFDQPAFRDPDTGEEYKLEKDENGLYSKEDAMRISLAAVNLLKLVRKRNPDSHIVWIYGMLGYDLGPVLAEAFNIYTAETGDSNVKFIMLPAINSETVGARNHPGTESHKIAAGILTDHLRNVLV